MKKPTTPKVPVTVRLPAALHRKLVKIAKAEGVSLQVWMAEALTQGAAHGLCVDAGPVVAPVLSAAMSDHINKTAAGKGVTPDTLVRLAMASLSKHAGEYAPDTRMGFGKYTTETVETVIRCDPAYICWARQNVDRFYLNDEAAEILAGVLGSPA